MASRFLEVDVHVTVVLDDVVLHRDELVEGDVRLVHDVGVDTGGQHVLVVCEGGGYLTFSARITGGWNRRCVSLIIDLLFACPPESNTPTLKQDCCTMLCAILPADAPPYSTCVARSVPYRAHPTKANTTIATTAILAPWPS